MELVIIFFIGIISGFLGATVGSGGLISIPALLLTGLPTQVALATNKVGDTGIFLAAIREYWKNKKIQWDLAIKLSIITICGAFLGSFLFSRLTTTILDIYTGVVILIALSFLFINKKFGLKKKKSSTLKIWIGYVLYFILSVNGAIVSAGGASMKLMVLVFLLGFTFLEGYATSIPSHFFSASIPAVIYIFMGYVDIPIAISLTLGGILGGVIGSKIAIKKGNKWLKGLFVVVVIVAVIKLFFF